MKKATDSSYLIALDIAEKLVLKEIPFRTTHKIVGSLVQQAHHSKKPLNKLTSNEIKKSVEGTKVNPSMVSEIIKSTTIVSSLRDRISFGSSGYAEQKRMIKDRIKKINDYRTNITKRENELSNALESLDEKISILIK
jgi:argininosuccinate lyase